MNHRTRFCIQVASLLLLTATSTSVYADLNANEIYALFNAMNGGQGFRFSYEPSSPILTPISLPEYQNVNTDAYIDDRRGVVGTPGQAYFDSFCLAPNLPGLSDALGRINYDPVSGHSETSQGYVLTTGAAYLYKEFATSLTPLGIAGNIDSLNYAVAIRALMGITSVSDWTQNVYLNKLLNMNSRMYWTQPYDASHRYDEIGDYSVFVLNVTDSNGNGQYQDFIYIAYAISDVPEPAMLLLWTIGGLGLYGSSASRKRRLKKLAF